MSMINDNIGIYCKKLTEADMGDKASSNQTHIGLIGQGFPSLKSGDVADAYLLYEGSAQRLPVYYKLIGDKRSPLIQAGLNKHENSITKEIRNIIRHISGVHSFYLLWFVYYDKPIFWLVRNGSDDYRFFSNMNILSAASYTKSDNIHYSSTIKYLEQCYQILDFEKDCNNPITTEDAQTSLSVNSEDVSCNFAKDENKEQNLLSVLSRLKKDMLIKSFQLSSGCPYDFSVVDNSGNFYFGVEGNIYSNQFVVDNQFISFINNQNCRRIILCYKDDKGYNFCKTGFEVIEGLLDILSNNVTDIYKYHGCRLLNFEIGMPLDLFSFEVI